MNKLSRAAMEERYQREADLIVMLQAGPLSAAKSTALHAKKKTPNRAPLTIYITDQLREVTYQPGPPYSGRVIRGFGTESLAANARQNVSYAVRDLGWGVTVIDGKRVKSTAHRCFIEPDPDQPGSFMLIIERTAL